MPQLRKVEVEGDRRRRVSPEVQAESISKIIYDQRTSTNDVYRFGQAVRRFFDANPAAKKQFVTWYENQ